MSELPWKQPGYDERFQDIIDIICEHVHSMGGIDGNEWLEGTEKAADAILALPQGPVGWRDRGITQICLVDALFAIEGSKAVGDDPKDMAYNEGLEEAKAALRALPAAPGQPEQPSVAEAAQEVLERGLTDETNSKIATAMALVLRADIDPSAWNTDCEMLNAFSAGLHVLTQEAE